MCMLGLITRRKHTKLIKTMHKINLLVLEISSIIKIEFMESFEILFSGRETDLNVRAKTCELENLHLHD